MTRPVGPEPSDRGGSSVLRVVRISGCREGRGRSARFPGPFGPDISEPNQPLDLLHEARGEAVGNKAILPGLHSNGNIRGGSS